MTPATRKKKTAEPPPKPNSAIEDYGLIIRSLMEERDHYIAALELIAEDDDPAGRIARDALKRRDAYLKAAK